MYSHHRQLVRRTANWKLFQIFCILQNCLILQVACFSVNSNSIPGGHGLLRGTINGILFVNHTKMLAPKSEDGEILVEKMDPKIQSTTMLVESLGETGSLEDRARTLSSLGLDEEDYEEDTNKAKRSKGFIKRLLQRFGLVSASSEPPQREREFEAQVAEDDSSVDADSPSDAMTTSMPSTSLLAKLNPINKITYKINTARNVVNRALNVVGLGSKPAETPAEGATGDGGEQDDEAGATRDSAGTTDDSSSSGVVHGDTVLVALVGVAVFLGCNFL